MRSEDLSERGGVSHPLTPPLAPSSSLVTVNGQRRGCRAGKARPRSRALKPTGGAPGRNVQPRRERPAAASPRLDEGSASRCRGSAAGRLHPQTQACGLTTDERRVTNASAHASLRWCSPARVRTRTRARALTTRRGAVHKWRTHAHLCFVYIGQSTLSHTRTSVVSTCFDKRLNKRVSNAPHCLQWTNIRSTHTGHNRRGARGSLHCLTPHKESITIKQCTLFRSP